MRNQVAYKTLRAFHFTMLTVVSCDIISLMNAPEQLAATKIASRFPSLASLFCVSVSSKGGGNKNGDDETFF